VLELDRAELDFEFLGGEWWIDDLVACAAFDDGVAFREFPERLWRRDHWNHATSRGISVSRIALYESSSYMRWWGYPKSRQQHQDLGILSIGAVKGKAFIG